MIGRAIGATALLGTALLGTVLLATALLAGCDEAEPEATAPALVDDVAAIQRVMADDLAVLSLEEVEAAVDQDLPARAAELLEQGAIPAARRQLEALEALEAGTEEGRALRDEGAELLRGRIEALASYRAVLARGLVDDDLALLDAIRDQRRAEDATVAFFDRLEAIRPLPEAEEPRERRVRDPGAR